MEKRGIMPFEGICSPHDSSQFVELDLSDGEVHFYLFFGAQLLYKLLEVKFAAYKHDYFV